MPKLGVNRPASPWAKLCLPRAVQENPAKGSQRRFNRRNVCRDYRLRNGSGTGRNNYFVRAPPPPFFVLYQGAGYNFAYWTDGEVDHPAGQDTLTFHADRDLTVRAIYESVRYSSWLSRHFSAADIIERSIDVAPDYDPDGLGLPNLARYALALGPSSFDRSHLPHGRIVSANPEGTNEEFMAITFTRVKGATDIEFIVESSVDLEEWIPLPGQPVTESITSGNVERVTIRDVVPVSDEAQRFLRLRIRWAGTEH